MINIVLISGFLGAGKTTFIKWLIEQNIFNPPPVLIENDFGSTNIDKQILEKTNMVIKELNSGCICCSLTGNFTNALDDIIEEFSPEYLIIEPSGVGKLSEIQKALVEFLSRDNVKLLMCNTIVDVTKFKMNSEYVEEYFWNQINNAANIILNKTKMISTKQLDDIKQELAKRHPNGSFIPWEPEMSLNEVPSLICDDTYPLLNKNVTHNTLKDIMYHRLPKNNININKDFVSDYSKQYINNKQKSLKSETIITDNEYTDDELDKILQELTGNDIYGNIIRLKGIIKSNKSNLLIECMENETSIKPIESESSGEVVVIGSDINRQQIQELFNKI